MKYTATIIGGYLDGQKVGFENKPLGFDFDERSNGATLRTWRYKIESKKPFSYKLAGISQLTNTLEAPFSVS